MRYRKLDENNDLVFGHGSTDYYINNAESVGLSVFSRLRLILGEWFLDLDEGTPWIDGILGKTNRNTINYVITNRILETPNVTGIEDYNVDIDSNNRIVNITVTINTIYGQYELNEVING